MSGIDKKNRDKPEEKTRLKDVLAKARIEKDRPTTEDLEKAVSGLETKVKECPESLDELDFKDINDFVFDITSNDDALRKYFDLGIRLTKIVLVAANAGEAIVPGIWFEHIADEAAFNNKDREYVKAEDKLRCGFFNQIIMNACDICPNRLNDTIAHVVAEGAFREKSTPRYLSYSTLYDLVDKCPVTLSPDDKNRLEKIAEGNGTRAFCVRPIVQRISNPPRSP